MAAAEHKERAWLAWHSGVIAAIAMNGGKVPRLSELTGVLAGPARPKTADELMTVANMWVARGSGTLTKH